MDDARKAKILMLDLSPESGLGAVLQGLLKDAPDLDLRRDILKGNDDSRIVDEILVSLARHRPDACFLLMKGDFAAQCPQLFERSIRGGTIPPTIAVLDRGAPREVEELLNSGISDFLIPPLEPTGL